MALQSILVYLLVTGCFAYAAWTLLPQAALRPLVNGLLRLSLPQVWRAVLQRTVSTSGGCHCSGCDQAQPKTKAGEKSSPPATQVLVFHPRKRP